jgi:hypothetical protein
MLLQFILNDTSKSCVVFCANYDAVIIYKNPVGAFNSSKTIYLQTSRMVARFAPHIFFLKHV